jgi:hypothetical protein
MNPKEFWIDITQYMNGNVKQAAFSVRIPENPRFRSLEAPRSGTAISMVAIISGPPEVIQGSPLKRIPLELKELYYVQGVSDASAVPASPVKGIHLLAFHLNLANIYQGAKSAWQSKNPFDSSPKSTPGSSKSIGDSSFKRPRELSMSPTPAAKRNRKSISYSYSFGDDGEAGKNDYVSDLTEDDQELEESADSKKKGKAPARRGGRGGARGGSKRR